MKKVLLLSAALGIFSFVNAQEKEVVKKKGDVKKASEKVVKESKEKATKVVEEKVQPAKKAVEKAKSKAVGKNGKLSDKAIESSKIVTAELEKPQIDEVQSIKQVEPISKTPTTSVEPNTAQQAPAAPAQDPNKNFEFTNDNYDFGKIPAGKPAKYTLTIKNISSEPQELTLVQPGCGCTTPEYTQNQKIAPGESAKVVLGFNGGSPSSGSPFSKSVTVTLKGHNPKVVMFRGETFAVPTESAPTNNATDKLKPAGQ